MSLFCVIFFSSWLKGIIYAFIDFLSSRNNAVKNFLCSSTTVFFVFAIVKGLFTQSNFTTFLAFLCYCCASASAQQYVVKVQSSSFKLYFYCRDFSLRNNSEVTRATLPQFRQFKSFVLTSDTDSKYAMQLRQLCIKYGIHNIYLKNGKKEEVSRYHIFTTRFYILCIYAWLLKE